MWNLKYDTNELIYETETNSQTQRTDLWLPKGRDGGRGKDWESGIRRCKPLYLYRMYEQQSPTLQHRELQYIQYPVINHNGKEYGKECTYMYN